MTARAAALRRDLEPFACLHGPTEVGGELRATVTAGDLEVTIAARPDGALVASCAIAVSGLYADVTASPLATLAVRASDPAYAAALVAGVESRLLRIIANRGHARLRFGRWEVHASEPAPSARAVVEVTAALGRRPLELAEAWSALASALGARWRGGWGTRGETAFALVEPAVTVELQAWAEDDGVERVHTVVTRGRDRVVRPGVILAPDAIAAVIRELTGVAIAVSAPRAPTAAPAPLTFADWPASRHGGLDVPAAGRARWQPGPPVGADASRGLDERVAIAGVDVTTRCADDARIATEVAAAAAGTGPLALTARPGYRFLRGLFTPAPRLDDAAFDDRYLLDTDDVAWARWWLGASEREAIAATFHAEAAHPFALALADQQLRFTAAAAPARAHLDAARHATAFLARRRDRATAEWRAVAAALDAAVIGAAFTVDGGLIVRTGRGAAAIEVAAALDDGRLVTVARAGQLDPAAPEPPTLVLDAVRAPRTLSTRVTDARALDGPDGYHARTTDETWARPRLAALASPLATARPDQVVVRGELIAVRWAGPQLAARTLAAGVELVARLCRGGSLAATPYR